VISRAGLYCTENLVPHWESIPRTVQPVASRYTDYVTPAHETKKKNTAAEDMASVAGRLSLYAVVMTHRGRLYYLQTSFRTEEAGLSSGLLCCVVG